MKKILIPALLVSAMFASEQNYIEIGGGAINYKDNFSTESNKNISNLGSAKSETEGIPSVNFYYGYDLNESINIYATSEMGDLNIGSSFETDYGFFDIGLKGNTGEEWENPFLTGVNREKTDTKEFGAYIGYGFSLSEDSESMIRYEFSKKSYDEDGVIKDLKRDGNRHVLALENMYNINLFDKESALISNLFYEKYDADGKSSSYNEYGLELGVSSQIMENTNLFLLTNYGKKDYHKFNSEVNKKVDVDIYGITAGIRVDKPFDYENTYVSFTTGFEKEKANVDFYDKENSFGLVSVGYKF